MNLHTSLRYAKAVMTPLAAPEIETDYANGAGSLQEDASRGLRCPLRGCGTWHHNLSQHIRRTHPALPVSGFRQLVGLPETAALISRTLAVKCATRSHGRQQIPQPDAAARARGVGTAAASRTSVGAQNLTGRYPAQLVERLTALAAELGHSPSFAEARVAWGEALMSWIVRHHGTWNGFKEQAGAPTVPRGGQVHVTLDSVLDLLARYVRLKGDLPTYDEAAAANQHAPETILRAFAEVAWPAAMRRAAQLLSLGSSRYLPVEHVRRRCENCGQVTDAQPCNHCGAAWKRVA